MSTDTVKWHERIIRLAEIDEAASAAAQSRVSVDWEIVDEYAGYLEAGATFPAVRIFFDAQQRCILADGFHRFFAHRKIGRESITALVARGTELDALLFSCRANSEHGLRRTQADKRRSVALLLAQPDIAGWSNRKIADAAAVSDMFVAKVRGEMEAAAKPADPKRLQLAAGDDDRAGAAPIEKRIGVDGKSRQVRPRSPAKPASQPTPSPTPTPTPAPTPVSRPQTGPTTPAAVDESLAAVVSAFVRSPGWSASRLKKARAIVNRIAAELSQLVLVAPDGDAATNPRHPDRARATRRRDGERGASLMIAELLEHWAALGCEFAVDSGDVIFDAPADVDLDELADAIRPRKAAVVAYLQSRSGEAPNAAASAATAVAEPVRNDAAVATGDEREDSEAKPITPAAYAAEEDGVATWDEGTAWDDSSKHCPRCRSAAIWVSFSNKTRCTNCSPPERARQLLETAEQFRRRLGIAPPLGAAALLGAMRGRRHWRPKPEAAAGPNRINKPR